MAEIRTEKRTRESFSKITQTTEEYDVYIASNGEEFFSPAKAKIYQNELERMMEFRSVFSPSKKNFRKGKQELAYIISNKSRITSRILADYFWIKVNEDTLPVLRNFLNKHYKIQQYRLDTIDINMNEWVFMAIVDTNGTDRFLVYWCYEDFIEKQINELKSLIPDFSKEEPVEQEEEDLTVNKFDILDFGET